MGYFIWIGGIITGKLINCLKGVKIWISYIGWYNCTDFD